MHFCPPFFDTIILINFDQCRYVNLITLDVHSGSMFFFLINHFIVLLNSSSSKIANIVLFHKVNLPSSWLGAAQILLRWNRTRGFYLCGYGTCFWFIKQALSIAVIYIAWNSTTDIRLKVGCSILVWVVWYFWFLSMHLSYCLKMVSKGGQ